MRMSPEIRMPFANVGSRVGSMGAAVIITVAYALFVVMVGIMFTEVLLAIVSAYS